MADTVEFPSLVKLGVAARQRVLLIGKFLRFWTLRRGAGGREGCHPVVCSYINKGCGCSEFNIVLQSLWTREMVGGTTMLSEARLCV